MKTNFNDQKGKPNGKGMKNKASDTVEKNKSNQQNITGKETPGTNPPNKQSPDGGIPNNNPGKNDPTGILQEDPWKEPDASDSNRDGESDSNNDKNKSSNRNPLKNDPTNKMPPDKSSVTDPTIDENTINDSLF